MIRSVTHVCGCLLALPQHPLGGGQRSGETGTRLGAGVCARLAQARGWCTDHSGRCRASDVKYPPPAPGPLETRTPPPLGCGAPRRLPRVRGPPGAHAGAAGAAGPTPRCLPHPPSSPRRGGRAGRGGRQLGGGPCRPWAVGAVFVPSTQARPPGGCAAADVRMRAGDGPRGRVRCVDSCRKTARSIPDRCPDRAAACGRVYATPMGERKRKRDLKPGTTECMEQ